MDLKIKAPVICRQCRKEIKTEAYKCIPCEKFFHPSCCKLHKVYNKVDELIPCNGKVEKYTVKNNNEEENRGERNGSGIESGRMTEEQTNAATSEVPDEKKIDSMYRMVEEIKNQILGREVIRRIREVIDEEVNKIRQEIKNWKGTELESLIGKVVRNEIQKSIMTVISKKGTTVEKSYSGAVKNEGESVIIIKPIDEIEENSSEVTKKDIKSKIDISKLGVGITKLKKATRGAVVVGCETKVQADKLKNEVAKDLGDKYVIQAPKRKPLKIKIHDVDNKDCESEQEFWEKIGDQNGIGRNVIEGKIIHRSTGRKAREATIIAEVNAKTREALLNIQKLKIGWKLCKVEDYISILRCFKCCGFYHFAKDCAKKEMCGICAKQHSTKGCKNDSKKCVNCEEKIKNFKIKNLNTDHSAYDRNFPCLMKELGKQREKILSNL